MDSYSVSILSSKERSELGRWPTHERRSNCHTTNTLREDTLERLHTGHQGITKCHQRARDSVWWPGIKRDIENKVSKCLVCCKFRVQNSEPLIPSEMPERPWQKVGSDLFELKDGKYLLVVAYYFRFVEIAKLTSTTSTNVITHLKSVFACHGIPQVLMSDNGPQYSAEAFEKFAKRYGFQHQTSSPKYPQANGAAERAVKTVKQLLKKIKIHIWHCNAYRDTPLENGYSPAELLMGRRLRTNLPIKPSQLNPKLLDSEEVKAKERRIKERTKKNFDKYHRARELPPLQPGETVWIPETQSSGTVVNQPQTRSYEVQTDRGTLRRNRRDLARIPESPESPSPQTENRPKETPVTGNPRSHGTDLTVTQSGCVSKPPQRLM